MQKDDVVYYLTVTEYPFESDPARITCGVLAEINTSSCVIRERKVVPRGAVFSSEKEALEKLIEDLERTLRRAKRDLNKLYQ